MCSTERHSSRFTPQVAEEEGPRWTMVRQVLKALPEWIILVGYHSVPWEHSTDCHKDVWGLVGHVKEIVKLPAMHWTAVGHKE